MKAQLIIPIVNDRKLLGIMRFSRTVANSRIFDRGIIDSLQLLNHIFVQMIYSFQPRIFSKVTEPEGDDGCKTDKSTQERILQDIESINSMLGFIYENVASPHIKKLIDQNRTNMETIHQEYVTNTLKQTIALYRGDELTEHNPSEEVAAPLHPKKEKINLLIADDVKLNASILEALLKDSMHNIYVASDGDIALEKMEKLHALKEDVDVLFLDHHMPNMLGTEVVDNLLAHKEKYTDNKIYIVSITNDPPAIENKKELYDFHIRKPFMRDQICDILHEVKERIQNE